MIPYEILKELIIHGVRFSYVSYDHKKALNELKEIVNTYNLEQNNIHLLLGE